MTLYGTSHPQRLETTNHLAVRDLFNILSDLVYYGQSRVSPIQIAIQTLGAG